MVIDPEQAETAQAIFDKWDLDYANRKRPILNSDLFKDGERVFIALWLMMP